MYKRIVTEYHLHIMDTHPGAIALGLKNREIENTSYTDHAHAERVANRMNSAKLAHVNVYVRKVERTVYRLELDNVRYALEQIEEYGDSDPWLIMRSYYRTFGEIPGNDIDWFERYRGVWRSLEIYAEELFDELYLHDLPEHVRPYIDYKAFARDLDCSGEYYFDDETGIVWGTL